MSPRFLALAATALLCLPGCGSEAPDSENEMSASPASFAGTYHVSGRTVETESGQGRDIEGTIVITQDGDDYATSFELTTAFPTPGGPTEAQVVGTGTGALQGQELIGTASTQIILAQVPGVDVGFAFLPRTYGPRITSQSTSRLEADGSLTIEITNEAEEGQSYLSTRTTVRGARISNRDAAE